MTVANCAAVNVLHNTVTYFTFH